MEKLLLILVVLLPLTFAALPKNFKVNYYDLNLTVASSSNSLVVTGSVNITLTCQTNTTDIEFHWGQSLTPANPAISNFTVTYLEVPGTTNASIKLTPIDVSKNNTRNSVKLTLPQSLAQNSILGVLVNFQTKINSDKKGLFLRQYSVENNQNGNIILSNLRPTYARELFPCFDEPNFDAALNLTLTRPNTWSFATTLPLSSPGTPGTSTTTDIFKRAAGETMPPNVFTIFGTDNMVKNDSKLASTTLTFWSRKSLNSTILTNNIELLTRYYELVENVIGIGLPTKQLQIVMVPGLEAPLAGYGIIFIREDTYNLDYTDPQKEGLFRTNVAPIVYEFVRQFSEFSTRPAEWKDYWFTQAIARFFQYTILNMILPGLDFKTDLEVVARQTALFLDSFPSTKPLEESDVDADSDPLVLSVVKDPMKGLKGAFILSMFDQAFPSSTVFTAIKSFLNTYKERLVTSDQFYIQITNIVKQSSLLTVDASKALSSINNWFNSTRYPLITVKIESTGYPGSVSFTSTGYCSGVETTCSTNLSFTSYVPATVGSKTDNRYYIPQQDLWINSSSGAVTSLSLQDSDWVVANMKSGGYYRANYDAKNWERIIQAVATNDLRLMGKTQLLDDAFALATDKNLIAYNVSIRLALANLGDTSYRNWVPIKRGLQNIHDAMYGLPNYSAYESFAKGYFQNLNAYLQNSSMDSFERARIQALFEEELCEFNIANYRSAAVNNLTNFIKGSFPTTVPSSVYESMVCCGARYSTTQKAQNLFSNLSDTTKDFYSRHYAAIALGCLSNYSDISSLFKTMNDSNIQLNPYIETVLLRVAIYHPSLLLTNISTYTELFQNKLGAQFLTSIIATAGGKLNNVSQASGLNILNSANVDQLVKDVATSTMNLVSAKATWLAAYNNTLQVVLQTYTLPTSSGATASTIISLSALLISFILMLIR